MIQAAYRSAVRNYDPLVNAAATARLIEVRHGADLELDADTVRTEVEHAREREANEPGVLRLIAQTHGDDEAFEHDERTMREAARTLRDHLKVTRIDTEAARRARTAHSDADARLQSAGAQARETGKAIGEARRERLEAIAEHAIGEAMRIRAKGRSVTVACTSTEGLHALETEAQKQAMAPDSASAIILCGAKHSALHARRASVWIVTEVETGDPRSGYAELMRAVFEGHEPEEVQYITIGGTESEAAVARTLRAISIAAD